MRLNLPNYLRLRRSPVISQFYFLSRRNISNKLSVEFAPGRIIRWRKRRFVVVDCTGFEAIIESGSGGAIDGGSGIGGTSVGGNAVTGGVKGNQPNVYSWYRVEVTNRSITDETKRQAIRAHLVWL